MDYGEFHSAATFGLSEVQRAAFVRGVYEEHGVKTASEALVLLWAKPQSKAACSSRVVHKSSTGLFKDCTLLKLEVPRALDKLLPTTGADDDEPLYELDWAQ